MSSRVRVQMSSSSLRISRSRLYDPNLLRSLIGSGNNRAIRSPGPLHEFDLDHVVVVLFATTVSHDSGLSIFPLVMVGTGARLSSTYFAPARLIADVK
jgi:hypothetical protein